MIGIYGIRNMVDGKWYVGQSVQIEVRRECHFSLAKHGKHYNAHLQRAFLKYGKENFEFRILEETTETQ